MNREITSTLWPISGDVTSQAGNPLVTVTGIQNIPVLPASGFLGGEMMEYNVNTNTWQPTLRACVQVNNNTVSTDYSFSVNAVTGCTVNGTGTF